MKKKPKVAFVSLELCACGHHFDSHGTEFAYPGSSACSECPCIAFEPGPPPTGEREVAE